MRLLVIVPARPHRFVLPQESESGVVLCEYRMIIIFLIVVGESEAAIRISRLLGGLMIFSRCFEPPSVQVGLVTYLSILGIVIHSSPGSGWIWLVLTMLNGASV